MIMTNTFGKSQEEMKGKWRQWPAFPKMEIQKAIVRRNPVSDTTSLGGSQERLESICRVKALIPIFRHDGIYFVPFMKQLSFDGDTVPAETVASQMQFEFEQICKFYKPCGLELKFEERFARSFEQMIQDA